MAQALYPRGPRSASPKVRLSLSRVVAGVSPVERQTTGMDDYQYRGWTVLLSTAPALYVGTVYGSLTIGKTKSNSG